MHSKYRLLDVFNMMANSASDCLILNIGWKKDHTWIIPKIPMRFCRISFFENKNITFFSFSIGKIRKNDPLFNFFSKINLFSTNFFLTFHGLHIYYTMLNITTKKTILTDKERWMIC